jgi:hypothetical protein
MSREDLGTDKFLEELLGPVVGELGVRVAQYAASQASGVRDQIIIDGGLKTLADRLGMTEPDRIEKLSSVLHKLSSLRMNTTRWDTWLLMWTNSPRMVTLTVGRGLSAETLDEIVSMSPEERAQVQLKQTMVVKVRA